MPYYLSSYVGRGTDADPCRPLGADEPGWAAIDLRADGGATPTGNGLNASLLYLPTARQLAGLDLLAEDAREPTVAATLTRLRNVLGLPDLVEDPFDALVLALLLRPPANGWRPLVVMRRTQRFEVHLGPLTRTLHVLRGGATAQDTFNRANESPVSGNWTQATGTTNLTSQGLLVAAGGVLSHVYWNPTSFGNDQFSQATVPPSLNSGGPCCRSDGASPVTFYAATNILTDEHLIKYVSGTSTLIQSVTYASGIGDVVRLEVEGSTLRYRVNGATVPSGTATDTAIPTGGRVGLYSVTGQTFDTWAGGDLTLPSADAAPTFVAAGALATNAAVASMAVTAPTLAANDIMIASLVNKALGNVISPPDGTWTEIIQDDADCNLAVDDHRFAVYWKRAASGDSGAAFTFTKVTDDNQLFAGVISAWRGCVTTGSPIDGGAAAKTSAAADNVSFPALWPAGPNEAVVFIAFYGNDLTTFAAAMSSDTNPDCTTRFDLENSGGTDCSIACTSGPLTGAPFVGVRTWASASTTDAGSTGVVFGLKPPTVGGTVVELTVSGTLASAGLLVREPARRSASTLPSAGALTRQLSLIRTVTGTLPSAGALARAPAKRAIGILNLSGTLGPAALFKRLVGTVPMAGTLATQRQQTRSFAGTLGLSGLLQRASVKVLVGVLPMTGTLQRQLAKAFVGVLPMTGSVKASPQIRQFAGVLGSAGTIQMIRSQTVALIGTLPMTGTVKGLLSSAFSGILPSTGTLRITSSQSLVGVLASTGRLVFGVALKLAGAMPTAGTVAFQQGQALSLAGTVPMASEVRLHPALDLPGSLGTEGQLTLQPALEYPGSLGLEGVVSLGMDMQVTGLLGLDGTLEMVGGRNVDVGGAIPMTGSTLMVRPVAFSGAVPLASTLRRQPSKPLRSLLSASGEVTTGGFVKIVTGVLSSSGVLTRQVSRRVVSVLTPVGQLVKQVQKRMVGATALAGTVTLLGVNILALTGIIVPSGVLAAPLLARAFAGAIGFVGILILTPAILVRQGTIKLINAILRFAGFTSPKLTGHGKPKDPALGGHSTLDDSELR